MKKKTFSEKFSDLYLMKIQICFVVEKNLDLYLRKIKINFVIRKR